MHVLLRMAIPGFVSDTIIIMFNERMIRLDNITYPKSLSDIRNGIRKMFRISIRTFPDLGAICMRARSEMTMKVYQIG